MPDAIYTYPMHPQVRQIGPGSCLIEELKQSGLATEDMSNNEMAKLHVRHLVGGHAHAVKNEIVYRFEFPDCPGALMNFLNHEPQLEHQSVSLSQPRRRLRPRADRYPGAAGGEIRIPGFSRSIGLSLLGRNQESRI